MLHGQFPQCERHLRRRGLLPRHAREADLRSRRTDVGPRQDGHRRPRRRHRRHRRPVRGLSGYPGFRTQRDGRQADGL